MKIELNFKSGKEELPKEDKDLLIFYGNFIGQGYLVKKAKHYDKLYENHIWTDNMDYDGGDGPWYHISEVMWCYQLYENEE